MAAGWLVGGWMLLVAVYQAVGCKQKKELDILTDKIKFAPKNLTP